MDYLLDCCLPAAVLIFGFNAPLLTMLFALPSVTICARLMTNGCANHLISSFSTDWQYVF